MIRMYMVYDPMSWVTMYYSIVQACGNGVWNCNAASVASKLALSRYPTTRYREPDAFSKERVRDLRAQARQFVGAKRRRKRVKLPRGLGFMVEGLGFRWRFLKPMVPVRGPNDNDYVDGWSSGCLLFVVTLKPKILNHLLSGSSLFPLPRGWRSRCCTHPGTLGALGA